MNPPLYFTQIRPLDQQHQRRLNAQQWTWRHFPLRQVVFLEQAKANLPLQRFDLLLLSSGFSADWCVQHRHQIEAASWAAVGGTTCTKMMAGGWGPALVSPPKNAEALVQALRPRGPFESVLYVRGQKTRATIPAFLKEHCHSYTQLCVYKTEPIAQLNAPPKGSMVYFQSPSSVQDFVAHRFPKPDYVAAIGPSTARELAKLGWNVDLLAQRPETEAFITQLLAWSPKHA